MQRLGICFTASVVLWGSLHQPARADREYRPADPAQEYRLSQPSQMVVQAMLQEMGLEFPDTDKVDPPAPAPGPTPVPPPEPKPEPSPQPTPPEPSPEDDDFFDDDFFDDDMSFDDTVAAMDAEFEQTVAAWDEEYERTVARWEKKRAEYLPKRKEYEEAAIELEGIAGSLQVAAGNRFQSNLSQMQPGEFHIIPNALELGVKNQARRGTCTAFAGVRALETMFVQHGISTDLSEEYFYFISKPSCMEQPCGKNREGSNTTAGLLASRVPGVPAVLSEADCPYTPNRNDSNITNTPLRGCSTQGVARAGGLSAARSNDQILAALRNNRPVVAGFTLTATYYDNKGLVTQYDPVNATRPSGPDAGGHANLLVGYIRLPDSLAKEGRYCVITANSWDEGWGRGGFACLTEAWLDKNGLEFAVLESATLTDNGQSKYGLQ